MVLRKKIYRSAHFSCSLAISYSSPTHFPGNQSDLSSWLGDKQRPWTDYKGLIFFFWLEIYWQIYCKHIVPAFLVHGNKVWQIIKITSLCSRGFLIQTQNLLPRVVSIRVGTRDWSSLWTPASSTSSCRSAHDGPCLMIIKKNVSFPWLCFHCNVIFWLENWASDCSCTKLF